MKVVAVKAMARPKTMPIALAQRRAAFGEGEAQTGQDDGDDADALATGPDSDCMMVSSGPSQGMAVPAPAAQAGLTARKTAAPASEGQGGRCTPPS